MGGLIAPEDWLVAMAQTDPKRCEVARRLVRMQIRTQHTSKHIVLLNTEYLHRHVKHAALYGDVAQVNVCCSRCGCIARLGDWVRSGAMDDFERNVAYVALRKDQPVWRCHFLADCPGPPDQTDLFKLLDGIDPAEEVLP